MAHRSKEMTSPRVKTVAIVAVIALMISVILFSSGMLSPTQERMVTPAPRFIVSDLSGKQVNVEDFKGTAVLLHFVYYTSETCPRCKAINDAQFGELRSIRERFGPDRLGLITINMNYDATGSESALLVERNNITWPVINDLFTGNNTNRLYNQTLIGGKYLNYLLDEQGSLINPTLILLDRELQISGVYHSGKVPAGLDLNSGVLTQEEIDNLLTAGKMAVKLDRLDRNEWGSTIEGRIYTGVSLGSMFVLGILVSVTPCALALMISLTSYVAGISKRKKQSRKGTDKTKLGLHMAGDVRKEDDAWFGASIGLAFTLGIGVVFFLMGCLFTYFGVLIQNAAVFYIIAGAVLILFGVHNIFGLDVIYERVKRRNFSATDFSDGDVKDGVFEKGRKLGLKVVDRYVLLGAFFLGMLLSLGWAPCALAFVFPALILVMTQQIPVLVGGLYLFIFSLGYGVPVVALAALTTSLKARFADHLMKFSKWIPKVFGAVIILLGILMILRWFGYVLW